MNTSILEVRPSNGESICVAELIADSKLKVLDLTSPRSRFSPTTFEDDKLISALSLIELLEALSLDLSIPITLSKKLNYLPTQFFCEFIKSLNLVQGIKFKSSFDDKYNYVFFEPINSSFFSIKNKYLKRITNVSVAYND